VKAFLSILALSIGLFAHAAPAGFSECSKQTLQNFFFDQGVPFGALVATDAKYSLPSREWLNDFCRQLKKEQQNNGVSFYVSAANNCTKFSRFGATIAAKLWLKHPDRLKDRAIAVGQVLFFSGEEIGHAVLCAVIREKAGLELVFIEPQGCEFTTLTPEEIRTGFFYF
jgi:hypothetical protein